MRKKLAAVVLAAGALALAGCGGGGGDELSALNPDRSDPVATVQAWIDLNTKPEYCTPEGAIAAWSFQWPNIWLEADSSFKRELVESFLSACEFGPVVGRDHWVNAQVQVVVANQAPPGWHERFEKDSEGGEAVVAAVHSPESDEDDYVVLYRDPRKGEFYLHSESLPIHRDGDGSAWD